MLFPTTTDLPPSPISTLVIIVNYYRIICSCHIIYICTHCCIVEALSFHNSVFPDHHVWTLSSHVYRNPMYVCKCAMNSLLYFAWSNQKLHCGMIHCFTLCWNNTEASLTVTNPCIISTDYTYTDTLSNFLYDSKNQTKMFEIAVAFFSGGAKKLACTRNQTLNRQT
jgi:hypothetical protein